MVYVPYPRSNSRTLDQPVDFAEFHVIDALGGRKILGLLPNLLVAPVFRRDPGAILVPPVSSS